MDNTEDQGSRGKVEGHTKNLKRNFLDMLKNHDRPTCYLKCKKEEKNKRYTTRKRVFNLVYSYDLVF